MPERRSPTGYRNGIIPRTAAERLRGHIEVDHDTGCHVYTGVINRHGYGVIRSDGGKSGRPRLAHQVAYEAARGAVPTGLVLDHLCRNRACVNSAHLEAVTSRENTLRGDTIPARNRAKTHCKRGHEFTPENTVGRRGWRECRACKNSAKRAYRKTRSATAEPPTPPLSEEGSTPKPGAEP